MKDLFLVLKGQWYDMIESGEKTEEYREFKDYWIARLCDFDLCLKFNSYNHFKPFDTVTFQHGYAKDARRMTFEFKGIEIRKGKPELGAVKGVKYFVIKLGKKL